MKRNEPQRSLLANRLDCRHSLRLLGGLAIVALLGCAPPNVASRDAGETPAEKPTGPAVKLVVDFDDGLEKHYFLAWRDGMTVLDALDAASRRPRGIVLSHKGNGDMAMVTAVDGMRNEGSGGKGRNWIYWVNGALAEKSCGVYEVRPEDVILWKFGTYE